MAEFNDLHIQQFGNMRWTGKGDMQSRGNLSLLIIRKAWNVGCDFEDLADGFGAGKGTMNGDWSGIRDSSDVATSKMLERALNHLWHMLDVEYDR